MAYRNFLPTGGANLIPAGGAFDEEYAGRFAEMEAVDTARRIWEAEQAQQAQVRPPMEFIGEEGLAEQLPGVQYSGEPGGEAFSTGGVFAPPTGAYSPEREKFNFLEKVAALGPDFASQIADERMQQLQELETIAKGPAPTTGEALTQYREGGRETITPEQAEVLPTALQKELALGPDPAKPLTEDESFVQALRARQAGEDTDHPFVSKMTDEEVGRAYYQWLNKSEITRPGDRTVGPPTVEGVEEPGPDVYWGPDALAHYLWSLLGLESPEYGAGEATPEPGARQPRVTVRRKS